MAGYPISELKKASESKGRDLFPIQQDGVTRQVELGILSNASKITASTSSGVITKEGSYVLQNNSAVINFTLNNAVGRAVSNNDYVDSASAAAGWIVKVINLSTRSHTVIAGSNSWSIAAGDVHEYYWTGSAWTLHVLVTETKLNDALSEYVKADVLSALPTDAVLHYSFDELPEVPDGTASYRHDRDFTSIEGWGGNATVIVNNGILTVTAGAGGSYVWTPITSIANSVIKIKARISKDAPTFLLYGSVNGTANTQLKVVNVKANEEFYIFIPVTGTLSNIGFSSIPANAVLEIISIYIGNSSYNSAVPDNSGNDYNGTINGALTTKGVSNKGLTALKYSPIRAAGLRPIYNNYSYSLWVRSNTTDKGAFYLIDGRKDGGALQDELFYISPLNQIQVGSSGDYKYSSENYFIRDLNYHLYTVVKENNTYKLYRDNALFETISVVNNAYIAAITLLSRYADGGTPTYNIDIDDFQLFDRALSAAEVQALHNARANTPKYNFSNVITEYNKAVVGEITIAANGTYTNTNIDIEKRGYDVIMPIIAVTGNNAVYCYNQGYANGKMLIQLKNTSSAAVTITPLANIIYKKK